MLPGEQAVPQVPCTCSQPSKMSRDQVLAGLAELSRHVPAPEEHCEAAAVSCCCFPVASGQRAFPRALLTELAKGGICMEQGSSLFFLHLIVPNVYLLA